MNTNVKRYKLIQMLKSGILFWSVQSLFYRYRGLSYLDITVIQSIGAILLAIMEIPAGFISDRWGHKSVLKLGALSKVLSVIVMIITIRNSIV